MINEILLDDFNETKLDNRFFTDLLKWWETKRSYFNLGLLILEVSIMLYYLDSTIIFGITEAIILTILTNIVANGFYCLGWILEILCYYYFRKYIFSNWLRGLLLAFGVLFSILLTLVTYINTLDFYRVFLD